MRKAILVLTVLFFISTSVNAQFQEGKSHAGPSIGLSFLGNTVSFGANYEYGMKLADIPGLIGVGALARYWSYSNVYWSYTHIVIGAQGNYHFKVGDGKVDPYVGLVLGFDAGSSSWEGSDLWGGGSSTSVGGVWFGAHFGARYWFSPKMAAFARIGAGSGTALDLGIDFKF